jgi:hypothetical protein
MGMGMGMSFGLWALGFGPCLISLRGAVWFVYRGDATEPLRREDPEGEDTPDGFMKYSSARAAPPEV